MLPPSLLETRYMEGMGLLPQTPRSLTLPRWVFYQGHKVTICEDAVFANLSNEYHELVILVILHSSQPQYHI